MTRLDASLAELDKAVDDYGRTIDRLVECADRLEAIRARRLAMEAGSIEAQRLAWASRQA